MCYATHRTTPVLWVFEGAFLAVVGVCLLVSSLLVPIWGHFDCFMGQGCICFSAVRRAVIFSVVVKFW